MRFLCRRLPKSEGCDFAGDASRLSAKRPVSAVQAVLAVSQSCLSAQIAGISKAGVLRMSSAGLGQPTTLSYDASVQNLWIVTALYVSPGLRRVDAKSG